VRRYVCYEVDAGKQQRCRTHRHDVRPKQCFAAIQQPEGRGGGHHQYADKSTKKRGLENVDMLRVVECGHELAWSQAEADRYRPDQIECENAQKEHVSANGMRRAQIASMAWAMMEIVRGGSDTSRTAPSVAMLRRLGKVRPAAITTATGERSHARRSQRWLDIRLLALREMRRGGRRRAC